MSFAAPERWVWWRIWCEPDSWAGAGRIGGAEVVAGRAGGGGARGVSRLAVRAAARKSAGSCRVRCGRLSSRRDSGAVGSVRESDLRGALVSLEQGRQAGGQRGVAAVTAAAGDPATAHGLCGGRLPALGDLRWLVRLTQAPLGCGGPTGPGALRELGKAGGGRKRAVRSPGLWVSRAGCAGRCRSVRSALAPVLLVAVFPFRPRS